MSLREKWGVNKNVLTHWAEWSLALGMFEGLTPIHHIALIQVSTKKECIWTPSHIGVMYNENLIQTSFHST